MKKTYQKDAGYTFIEVIIVIIIIGIMAAVAVQSLTVATDTSRFEETRREMDRLASAIAGNPRLYSGGVRSDYGYIGDIGALPATWDDLVTNPGGYATWNGPYISEKFSSGGTPHDFKYDAWGKIYSSPASHTFNSTGGTATLTRQMAHSTGDLLYNRISLIVRDNNFSLPGTTHKDSVQFILSYPDGFGATIEKIAYPNAGGYVEIDSIPIGLHRLYTVFLPQNDTLIRNINVDPGAGYFGEIKYYGNIW